MPITPYPIPDVTSEWAGILNEAIESRYQDALARIEEITGGDLPGLAASAVADTAAVVSFTNSAVYNAGAIIVVPPSERDMWIEWQAQLGLTTGADGAVLTVLYEVTGTPTFREAFSTRCRTSDSAAALWATHHGEYNAGPSEDYRAFALYGQTTRDAAGAYPVAYFHNNFFGYGKAWIAGGTR